MRILDQNYRLQINLAQGPESTKKGLTAGRDHRTESWCMGRKEGFEFWRGSDSSSFGGVKLLN